MLKRSGDTTEYIAPLQRERKRGNEMTIAKRRDALVKALQFEGWRDADKCTTDWTLEEMTTLLNKLWMARQRREGHI
jgi:hypothetical protein